MSALPGRFARSARRSRSLAVSLIAVLCAAGLLTSVMAVQAAPDAEAVRVSRISDGRGASEYWDIVARFDAGYELFTRFLITNEGPGERTAIATWYMVRPDGSIVPFKNGRRRARWTLSPERARLHIGSSILDQRGSVHALEYDSKKRKIQVHLRFSPANDVARTNPPIGGGYVTDLLELGTPVVGWIQLPDMSEPLDVAGTIAVTHTSVEDSEPEFALRRIEFFSTGNGRNLYVSEVTTPSGQRHRWLVVEKEDQMLHRSSDFELEMAPSTSTGDSKYPAPGTITLRGKDISGTIEPAAILVATNPLDLIPQPFRFLLSFKMNPHRVWANASFDVKLRTDPNLPLIALRGPGVTTITYLNPLPSSISTSPAPARRRISQAERRSERRIGRWSHESQEPRS